MIRTIEDFAQTWSYEAEATAKIMKALTDASLAQKVYAEGRTLGFLAWHLTLTLGEMGEKAGLKFDAPPEDAPVPVKAAEIAAAYEKAAAALVAAVKSQWTDAMLPVKIAMYGQEWPRSMILTSLITHQIHHRAQMTVLMRQAGLKVPGIYGPSREEWTAMGMQPLP